MRNYEFKLKLPVEFIPHTFKNSAKYHEIPLEHQFINQEFKNFLTSLNLYIDYAKHFYAVPNQKYMNHRDILDDQYDTIADNVKLNFVLGGTGSEMIWYELKPGIDLKFGKNYWGRLVPVYTDEDVVEVHRATIGWPSLLDAYSIHSLQNTNEPRQCWSITLNNLLTNKRLTWDDAVEIFKDYLIIE